MAPILVITLLHDPSVLGGIVTSAQTHDLSGAVAGFSDVDVEAAIQHACKCRL